MSEKKLHKIIEGKFESSEKGEHIYFRHYFPLSGVVSEKPIHIVFQHGAIEYHARYQEFFDFLRLHFKNRLVISCMDFLGHGLSGGARSHADDLDHYIFDFCNFTNICYNLDFSKDRDVFFIAHSMGGLVTLESLIDHEKRLGLMPRAVILSNPCIRPKLQPPKKFLSFAQGFSEYIAKLRLPCLTDGFDLTSDKERALSFECDHLNSDFMTLKLCLEVLKHSKKMTTLSYYLKTPSFFLLSGDDKIVDVETTKLFISGVDKDSAQMSFYPNARHDLLNEVGRKSIFKEICKYIEKTL